MKKIVLLILTVSLILHPRAQMRINAKKYPSLFWEISGNGLARPSYLFGTMHVSSKMVFHLPDSFYLGIRNVDVVALETNPESWQEDLVKYDLGDNTQRGKLRFPWSNFRQIPDDFLNIGTLQVGKYEKQIEAALYSRPSTINNLLYRNYSDYSSDFEENTYLDMYIYQVGKKMGKRVAGVEKYDESMKLMIEAYRDAAREKIHKQRSYDNDETYSADKLQEAYRTGNLDLLDSINRVNSFSDAFDEKFLYRRNLLQANSIDSILKAKSSMFVGVGAAHLPGNRGVIEILRKRGYKLRPIAMKERDSNQKDRVEKIRVPVNFNTQTSEDGFFKVDIPGKFYRFNEEGTLDQLQYADMANGSYYMVTRIKTNSLFWDHNEELVKKKIDSLLYENIPGKILSKNEILRNGYQGLDIINRTRRGDVQRYNIFITPYQVIIFKMSGNGDYVESGDESKRFFGSIRLKEYKADSGTGWQNFHPSSGGFSIDLPHKPFISKNGNWQYEAEDKINGTSYTILRTDIHNYSFVEEDTFDLGLLDESFSGSEFIDRQVSRKLIRWNGYPALDCKYLHKDGSVLLTRFIIQGPHYYTLIAHGRKQNAGMERFINSFRIKPFLYKEIFEKKDTSLNYTVRTSFYPEDKQIKLVLPGADNYSIYNRDEDDDGGHDGDDNVTWGSFSNNIIENDTTGEKIYVSFYKNGRYYYNNDSSGLDENRISKSGSWIVRCKRKYENTDDWRITEFQLSDTNSSRLIWTKSFYKNGIRFLLATEGDTLSALSSFVGNFFDSFTPSVALKGFNPFEKKSEIFFKDFFSTDTLLRKRALKASEEIKLDSTDFPNLRKAITSATWSEKKYMETKKSLITRLGDLKSRQVSDFLKELYYSAGDTVEVQYVVLESLLRQQTQYAFSIFKDIITAEPPVIEFGHANYGDDVNPNRFNLSLNYQTRVKTGYNNGDFWDELYDSIKLTCAILPDMLPLLTLDDYKWRIMRLLGRMIDSNLVTPADYEIYFNKFFIEAKQELKKQEIQEKKNLIKKASDKDLRNDDDEDDDRDHDSGNEKLRLYAKLLLPFWKINGTVQTLFQQLLRSNDKKLKYSVMLLLIRDHKPVPDSILNYFASMDDYRYALYSDLGKMDLLKLFPSMYNNQADLAKSKLLLSKSYGKPDSVCYLGKLPTTILSKQGYIYFFKYRAKKDDPVWKLATVGLLSADPMQFEMKDTLVKEEFIGAEGQFSYNGSYDFTEFTDSKLKAEEPVSSQLNKQLKKIFYSTRQSAKQFYDLPNNDLNNIFRFRN